MTSGKRISLILSGFSCFTGDVSARPDTITEDVDMHSFVMDP